MKRPLPEGRSCRREERQATGTNRAHRTARVLTSVVVSCTSTDMAANGRS